MMLCSVGGLKRRTKAKKNHVTRDLSTTNMTTGCGSNQKALLQKIRLLYSLNEMSNVRLGRVGLLVMLSL
jgi:hypothetical protein